ncbi:sensor histidine kinase [Larkinella soli]|uniref:sensor histidine kinase n=1 Tax=Larkinella soli TaxID=1770527 RepID=UPI0013E2CCE4|nr:histidine kinase [Larkinella soli]
MSPPIRFDDRLFRLFGIPLIAFMMPLVFFDHSLSEGARALTPIWLVSLLHTWIYWEGNRVIYFQTRRRFPLVSQTHRRLTWLMVLSVTFTLLACFVINGFLDFCLPNPNIKTPSTFTKNATSLILTGTCLAIYESVYYFRLLQAALLEAEQLKKENLQSQLETLKNQVNPHFLFNSLNTLASIIPEDADLAVEFVQKLSKVYRYILEIRDLQTVSLKEELTALKAYTFLLQIRFGENLNIRIDLPDEHLTDRLVPLSLQMLLENAVKHNIISTQKPLFIEVFIEKERVIVRNNLQRKNQPTDSTGLGLPNIRNRYQLLASQPVDVIVTTQAFAVSLPLLPARTPAGEQLLIND